MQKLVEASSEKVKGLKVTLEHVPFEDIEKGEIIFQYPGGWVSENRWKRETITISEDQKICIEVKKTACYGKYST